MLGSFTPGITTNGTLGFEGAQAMSTLLHETIHWWQHIGSTYGFLLSLNYQVQTHCIHMELRKLVELDGFKKSIAAQAKILNETGPTGFGTKAGTANIIINNHYDLMAFRAFTLGPDTAKQVAGQELFENVGHAFHMTYAHTVNQIASTVDKSFQLLSHPEQWEDAFRALRDGRVHGYYYGSPIGIWPIGAREIFEGQACFSQVQYLSHACGHRLDWDDFEQVGLLHGVYLKAFDEFLRLTQSSRPDKFDDPLIGLFLLVCDLAQNPGRGFPFPVAPNYESFIFDVDPGARFSIFCRLIASEMPDLKSAIRDYSRSEYAHVSGVLCKAAKEASPLAIAKKFSSWFSEEGPLSELRQEYMSYNFGLENFVIRHLFAHFLAFQEDKFRRPEFFCWPGAWMAGDRVDGAAAELFDKHGALFVDKEDDDAVFPRLQSGRDPGVVSDTFNRFYQHTSVYDLINQWISQPGPFRYDLGWLQPAATASTMEGFLRGNFKGAFQLDPDDVRIVDR